MSLYQQYIDDVESGKILTGKAIKLLVKRHQEDLKKKDFDFYFDDKEADKVIAFAQFLKHVKGPLRGKTIKLEPWQCFILVLIFGWKRKDNHIRRFQKVYWQIARKNSKTTMAVIILLYIFYTRDEGEFYSIATKRDQAKIAFDIAKSMIKMDEGLLSITKVLAHQICRQDCEYKAMASEDKKSDGFNPLVVLCDEYHAHKTDAMLDVYQSGMGARLDPLILITTTAGTMIDGPCKIEYDRAKKVLEGIFQDDTLLPIIYELDEKDDWKDLSCWVKANPNIDVSVSRQYLLNQYNEAEQKPSKKVDFLIKNLNRWVSGKSSWIPHDVWKRCQKHPEIEEGASCYGGIDLSSVSDLTCWSLYFPGEKIKAIHKAYIPEDSIQLKTKHETIQYYKWIEEGFIIPTPGGVVDHQYLIDDLVAMREIYQINEIGYDPALSAQVVTALEREGFDLVIMRQSLKEFSTITKDWEKDVRSGLIEDDNPVMAWCLSNAVIKVDTNGNYKPLQETRNKKIDQVITSIMAHARMMHNETVGFSGGSGILDLLDDLGPDDPIPASESSEEKKEKPSSTIEKSILELMSEG